MLSALEEHHADALGMSGLLVKSTLIMRENLELMNERGMSHVPVLLGGAALTRTYVERDLRQVYSGRVFYGKDAFEDFASSTDWANCAVVRKRTPPSAARFRAQGLSTHPRRRRRGARRTPQS